MGDIIEYGTSSYLAVIHGRTSATEYTVYTTAGLAPTAAANDATWDIFRAHTSLANAENGIENTGIDTNLRNFDDWDAGGTAADSDLGKNLTTLAEQSNLEAVYRAFNDAFRDHRGHVEESFEAGFARFQHWTETDSRFDPSLWFLAMDGDRIAGVSLCQENSWDDAEAGHINVLGVRREYRRRGDHLQL